MYAGAWEIIQSIIGSIGVTPEAAAAIARAFASPTLANIEAVKKEFAAAGTSPPPELMNALYGRYGEAVRDNPYMTAGVTMQTAMEWLPWVIGGGVLLIALSRRRKR